MERGRGYRYPDLPQACQCGKCGYIERSPGKHCTEISCPQCGGRMWRYMIVESKGAPKVVGAGLGALVGAGVAGPVGAVVGALVGYWVGNSV